MWELLFGPSDVQLCIFGAIASGIGSLFGGGGIGGLIGKGLGLAGKIFGSPAGSSAASLAGDKYFLEKKQEFSKREAQKTRDFQTAERIAQQAFSAEQAAKQMGFQERMASTQTQRATRDLEKAGLNRILALGSPAIAPQGAMASASQPSGATARSASGGEGSSAIARGISLMSAKQAVQLQKAHTFKTLEEGRAAGAKADQTEAMTIPFTMLLDQLGRSGAAAKEVRQWIDKIQAKTGGSFLDLLENAPEAAKQVWKKGKDAVWRKVDKHRR